MCILSYLCAIVGDCLNEEGYLLTSFSSASKFKRLVQSIQYKESIYSSTTHPYTSPSSSSCQIDREKDQKRVCCILFCITAISDYLLQSSRVSVGSLYKFKATCTHTLVGTKGFRRKFKDWWNGCCCVAESAKQTSLLASRCHFNYHVCWAQLQHGE